MGCEKCPLNECKRVPGAGPERARLVVVGEAPGRQELQQGTPFIGQAGKLLNTILTQVGIDRESVYIDNAVCCMEENPRTPTAKEVKCCSERLRAAVSSRSPKLVVALGKIAAKALLGINAAMDEMRGSLYYSDTLNTHVFVTYHPAAVLRKQNLYTTLLNDFLRVKTLLEQEEISVETVSVRNRVIADERELLDFLEETDSAEEVALDVETSSLGGILCIGLSVQPYEAVVLTGQALRNRKAIHEWLSRRKIIAHNAKFDLKMLLSNGFGKLPVGEDTMLQSYVLDHAVGGHGLKKLVAEVLGYSEDYEQEVVQYKKMGMELCPQPMLYEYNAKDAAFTMLLARKFRERLDAPSRKLLAELLYPASDALLDMEYTGIMVDVEYLRRLDSELQQELEQITHRMFEIVGHEFNPDSNPQLLEVMYKKLNLPIPMRLSTDKGALKILQRVSQHEFPELLVRYRERKKFHSTYVKALLNAVGWDGRVRTNFNLHTTTTGRLSSSQPVNLQNQKRGPEARNAFTATPGYLLIEGDFSQAEIRAWAWYAKDETLKAALCGGTDIHTTTARFMYGREDITSDERTRAKRVSFGTLYGQTPAGLAAELSISPSEAARLQEALFKAYSAGRDWIRRTQQEVLENGFFLTPFGRRLRFVVSNGDYAELMRQAVNYPIQSLASDVALSALVRLHRRICRGELGNTRLLVTVHDSVLLETAEDDVVGLAMEVKREMERPVLDGWMPFVADVKVGQRWGSLEEVL